MHNYWIKQTIDNPLYPDLIWSRPSNKKAAGKLLLVGGNSGGFRNLAEAYTNAEAADAGSLKVVMPDVLQKTLGKMIEISEYASSTPSGSLSSKSLATILDMAEWADAVFLAGDFGQNSETAILLENLADKLDGHLAFSGDSIDIVISNPLIVLNRPKTLLIMDFDELQKFFVAARFSRPITSSMSLESYVEALHEFTKRYSPIIMTSFESQIMVAHEGIVTSTKMQSPISLSASGPRSCVWWLQNPTKTIEALTSSLVPDK